MSFSCSYKDDVRIYDILSLERLVSAMADFRIHRQAMKLETILQQLMQTKGIHEYEMEITSIYDSPIKTCTEVLNQVTDINNLDTIDAIKQKYWPYQEHVLTQLDEAFCDTLCEDMKKCS